MLAVGDARICTGLRVGVLNTNAVWVAKRASEWAIGAGAPGFGALGAVWHPVNKINPIRR